MQMYLAGSWRSGSASEPVISPWTGEPVDEVPAATPADAELALAAAVSGAGTMRRLSAYDRSVVLRRAADLADDAVEDLARTISLEEGKPLSEARGEAGRAGDLLRLAASEGARASGETIPVDAAAGAAGKLAFTLRQPCGVVVAITPFNYPLLLVLHKVAPALAAGNAVILKPAQQTPLTALKLTRIFLEAGLPPDALQCLPGDGAVLGPVLCGDERVRKISFTGSTRVGTAISQVAGVKRLSLELGANCPVVVMDDADVELASAACAAGGYINAGQVCISVQRILVDQRVYGDFLDDLSARVGAIAVGDPLAEGTALSALITPAEAERVEGVIRRAADAGADVVVGGERDGGVVSPTVVTGVRPDMEISRGELFGPAVAVSATDDIAAAIAAANDSDYGLGAGIFTRDVSRAMRFARDVDCGNIHVNWTPLWRADLMPYGGLKGSGVGKEGPRYAVEEMTELKTVVLHGLDD